MAMVDYAEANVDRARSCAPLFIKTQRAGIMSSASPARSEDPGPRPKFVKNARPNSLEKWKTG